MLSVYEDFGCFMIEGNLPETEYFLLEYREKIGFDSGLPGYEGGVLIWHIDCPGIYSYCQGRLTQYNTVGL